MEPLCTLDVCYCFCMYWFFSCWPVLYKIPVYCPFNLYKKEVMRRAKANIQGKTIVRWAKVSNVRDETLLFWLPRWRWVFCCWHAVSRPENRIHLHYPTQITIQWLRLSVTRQRLKPQASKVNGCLSEVFPFPETKPLYEHFNNLRESGIHIVQSEPSNVISNALPLPCYITI